MSSPTPGPTPTHPTHPAHTLLLRAHTPPTAHTLFTTKIQHKPLLLRPTSPPPSTKARTTRRLARIAKDRAREKRRAKNKPRPLSARERKARGVDEISKEEGKWENFEGLRGLWGGYVRGILGVGVEERENGQGNGYGRYVTAASAGPMLASGDMHGAVVEVVKSRCVGRVGVRGTVVQDRKFVFVVVTEGDEVKTLPKEHTVFRLEVPLGKGEGGEELKPLVFEIHGEAFQNRAVDRAKKSFKMHYQPDL